MKQKPPVTRILIYQAIGFLTVILVSWLVEVTGLRMLILGDHSYISDFSESAFEMLIVLTVWLLVANSTRRILSHVRYLEGFMRVCAWCRHIHYKGEWIRIEQFMQEGFDTPTTHGICPGCLHKEKEALIRSRRKASRQRSNGKSDQPAKAASQPLSRQSDLF